MEFLEKIQQAGVVGAGGAGFPTHVKLKAKARRLILNAAECEPLIETDKFCAGILPIGLSQLPLSPPPIWAQNTRSLPSKASMRRKSVPYRPPLTPLGSP